MTLINCSTFRVITLVVRFHIVGIHICMLCLIENYMLSSVHVWKYSLGLPWQQTCIYFAGTQTFGCLTGKCIFISLMCNTSSLCSCVFPRYSQPTYWMLRCLSNISGSRVLNWILNFLVPETSLRSDFGLCPQIHLPMLPLFSYLLPVCTSWSSSREKGNDSPNLEFFTTPHSELWRNLTFSFGKEMLELFVCNWKHLVIKC